MQLEVNEESVYDFLSMALEESTGLEVHGNPTRGCTSSNPHYDPITFATSESYLALPTWECSDYGKISLKIRTTEGSGVILYSSGARNAKESRVVDSGQQHGSESYESSFDFFAIELLEGHVFMLMNQGSGSVRLKATTRRVDDGQWHSITVERKGKSGRVTVDDPGVDFITPGTSAQLDLEGPLFLGGIGHGDTSNGHGSNGHYLSSGQWSSQKRSGSNSIPPELWAGSLGHGFIGCVRDLFMSHESDHHDDTGTSVKNIDTIKNIDTSISGETIDLNQDLIDKINLKDSNLNPIDLSAYLSNSSDLSGIRFGCNSHMIPCEEDSCLNGGICSSGWNRISCNCAATSFTGPNCEGPSSMITFNGDQYVRFSLPEESKTQAEDFYLRFKTLKSAGLLLATSSKVHSMNHLIILLEHAHLKVILNMGEGNRVINIGSNLNDDQWHSLNIERRGSYLMVKLDTQFQDTPISGQLMTLIIDTIYLASFGRIHISSSSSLFHSTKEVPNYSGAISGLILNSKNLIEMMRSGQLSNHDSTALIISGNMLINREGNQENWSPFKTVTFKAIDAYVAVLPPKLSSNLIIHFLIKTTSINGIIMVHGNQDDEDYYLIELENGFIQYTFNLNVGRLNSGMIFYSSSSSVSQSSSNQYRLHRLSSHSSVPINDDEWHSVTISKSRSSFATKDSQAGTHHLLLVDDHLSSIPSPVISSSSSSSYQRSLSPSSILSKESSFTSDLNTSLHFDLSKRLVYIGGIPRKHNFYFENDPSADSSPTFDTSSPSSHPIGFMGCLASVDLNGQLIDLINGPDVIVSSSLVEPGCNEIKTCSFCASKGKCVKNQSTIINYQLTNNQSAKQKKNSQPISSCDCKLITYAGVTCEEHEGASFKFSSGVLIYTFPEDKKPETKSDELIIGIKTESIDDSILIRIDSTSSNDYIEVEMVDGHVVVIYNVGSADHFIEDLNVLINDNQYHVIKFNRSGPNATLQIDNHNQVLRAPSGKQLTIFDAQSTIQVGGRKIGRTPISDSRISGIEKPFKGVIFTLSFNGERLLDLAAEGDPKVSMEGRVELLVSISGITNLHHNSGRNKFGQKSGDKNRKSGKRNKMNKQSHEVSVIHSHSTLLHLKSFALNIFRTLACSEHICIYFDLLHFREFSSCQKIH